MISALWIYAACQAEAPPAATGGPPTADTAAPTDTRAAATNVLLILLDDVGVDKIGVYGDPQAPPTPNIDALAAAGIRFDNAYSSPICSTTRAEILTGRLARRYGMGDWIEPGSTFQLRPDAFLLPEALHRAPAPVASAVVGKWHLIGSGVAGRNSHPLDSGFDRFIGTMGNLTSYYSWPHVVDGASETSRVYATTQTTDDALRVLSEIAEPFFVYLAYNASHDPYHVPPRALRTLAVDDHSSIPDKVNAATEAVDTEIGRLLASMDPDTLARTTVIFTSDNGTTTEASATQSPGKGTVHEGGVNVPLIVAGPLVERPGTVSTALVHLTDLYPTLAEVYNAPIYVAKDGTFSVLTDDETPRLLDGRSILPLLRDPNAPSPHDTVYCERFTPNGPPPYGLVRRTVRDERFKFMDTGGVTEFFELVPGAGEGPNLLEGTMTSEQEMAFQRLSSLLYATTDALPFEQL